jgi:hypothetical protein
VLPHSSIPTAMLSLFRQKHIGQAAGSIVAIGLVTLAIGHAAAQSYPTRPITIIVPFPPLGGIPTL